MQLAGFLKRLQLGFSVLLRVEKLNAKISGKRIKKGKQNIKYQIHVAKRRRHLKERKRKRRTDSFSLTVKMVVKAYLSC